MNKKEVIGYIILLILVILLRTYVFSLIRVNGTSMYDTLKNNDIMILNKLGKNDINRFDIVVVDIGTEKVIKRVIGLPDEDIEYKENVLYINGKEIKNNYGNGNTKDFVDYCPSGSYFVMGDNRENSLDSRVFSCVTKKQILGKTHIILFPFNRIGKVD